MLHLATSLTPDEWLLAYIAAFGLLCAALIGRESRLGWAMFTKNVVYATVFGYAVLRRWVPEYDSYQVMIGVRWLLALALTWATVELVCARWPWRWHNGKPRWTCRTIRVCDQDP